MGALPQNPTTVFLVLILTIVSLHSCNCFNPRLFNVSQLQDSNSGWSPAGATWYGSPTGYGTEGGACGYGAAVGQPPFYSMVSAGGPSLYKSGKGCGACYQVKCTTNPACSAQPVTVVIMDECPGCTAEATHFDLSGSAFGAMAISGQGDKLRNAGILPIQYQRVDCNYPGIEIAFRVDLGSNPYYFATVVEFENGDGDLASVELKQGQDTDSWFPMQQSWGAVWKLNSGGSPLCAPFSIKLTTLHAGKTLIATSVIPDGWVPGQTYRSRVNF